VNFFGHAWLAARQGDASPGFVLGAMAPDLLAMAGRRREARAAVAGATAAPQTSHARGVRFHAATDEAFHAAPTFAAAQVEAAAALRAAGVRRGPARGVAHVGLELLLDGWLAREAGVPELYPCALRHEIRRDAAGLGAVCRRLAVSPLPEAYADPAEVARRVAAALGRRPRLALAAGERAAVAAWARKARRELATRAPAMLVETERALTAGTGSARAAARAGSAGDAAPPSG
jgi:hypothetical protein